jgi:hypothetical protein
MNTKKERISKRAGLIKIGIDMHLRNYRVVRQIDQSHPERAQKFKPAVFFLWLGKQLGLAEAEVVCYEAGCFGYGPAGRMESDGGEGVSDCAAELG